MFSYGQLMDFQSLLKINSTININIAPYVLNSNIQSVINMERNFTVRLQLAKRCHTFKDPGSSL